MVVILELQRSHRGASGGSQVASRAANTRTDLQNGTLLVDASRTNGLIHCLSSVVVELVKGRQLARSQRLVVTPAKVPDFAAHTINVVVQPHALDVVALKDRAGIGHDETGPPVRPVPLGMVPPAGFEPATGGLEGHCSIRAELRGLVPRRGYRGHRIPLGAEVPIRVGQDDYGRR